MRFTKVQGLGNDYLVLDALREPALAQIEDMSRLARAMSDRRTGAGADGVIVVCAADPASGAAFRMRIWNADGSEAEMCGNGLRGVVRLAVDRGHAPAQGETIVETLAGLMRCEVAGAGAVSVRMPPPRFDPESIPLDTSAGGAEVERLGKVTTVRIGPATGALVSVGNPHFVWFLEEPLEGEGLAGVGPMIERHGAFPQRINVHAAMTASVSEVTMASWERGAGLTQACGTGACAVFAVGRAMRLLSNAAMVSLPGGDLHLRADSETDELVMTGPASVVYDGEWPA